MTDGTETGSKVRRLADETRALVDDVKTWVDLRLQLTQLEVEGRVNEATAKGLVALVAGLAILFALVGLALFLGDVLGASYLGFLIVAGLLVAVTIVLWIVKPRIVRIDQNDVDS